MAKIAIHPGLDLKLSGKKKKALMLKNGYARAVDILVKAQKNADSAMRPMISNTLTEKRGRLGKDKDAPTRQKTTLYALYSTRPTRSPSQSILDRLAVVDVPTRLFRKIIRQP